VRALRIAVSSAVPRACRVGREASLAAIRVHLYEVESAVDAARETRHVDVEGELRILQLEELVCVVVFHEVRARAHVTVGAVGHKIELELIARGMHTVSGRVFSRRSLDDA